VYRRTHEPKKAGQKSHNPVEREAVQPPDDRRQVRGQPTGGEGIPEQEGDRYKETAQVCCLHLLRGSCPEAAFHNQEFKESLLQPEMLPQPPENTGICEETAPDPGRESDRDDVPVVVPLVDARLPLKSYHRRGFPIIFGKNP